MRGEGRFVGEGKRVCAGSVQESAVRQQLFGYKDPIGDTRGALLVPNSGHTFMLVYERVIPCLYCLNWGSVSRAAGLEKGVARLQSSARFAERPIVSSVSRISSA